MAEDVLKLLQGQQATNRENFATAQAARSEANATRPQQWTQLGRDADSGKMAIAADGSEAQLNGVSITSGHLKRGQGVRVNADGGFVTVDQKPASRARSSEDDVDADRTPQWIAFGEGFAVSSDDDAKRFTESKYPVYDDYEDSEQGDRMFPYGRITHFVAATATLWLVGGYLGFSVDVNPESMRLGFAVSTDQGQTWQASAQLIPHTTNSNPVSSVVWGQGSFFAIINAVLWRSVDGLEWEELGALPLFSRNQALFDDADIGVLAVWEGTVFFLHSLFGNVPDGSSKILKQTAIYTPIEDSQGKTSLTLAKRINFDSHSQYGAYNAYGNPYHDITQNLLSYRESLYPFLLSSGDLDAIADYGSAIYDPDPETYLNLLGSGSTNQRQAIAYSGNIQGQIFLMLSQYWGIRFDGKPFGFAAIHEGAGWRTCEHPFIGKLNGFRNVQSITYSQALDRWLVYTVGGFCGTGGRNGDSWDEPFQPELETAIERTANSIGFVAGYPGQIIAFELGGNYVS